MSNDNFIEAIIFDFDGVILESADIKTEAFKELFSDYPEKIDEITDYHLANAGISRYVKFRHIYEEFLGEELSKDKEIELGKRFSEIVLEKVLATPFVPGAEEFLDRNKNRYRFFIASGTPQEELDRITQARRLQGYFERVYGSPKGKKEILSEIIRDYKFNKEEVLYVGDAWSDRIAAEGAGVAFIERKVDLNPDSESNLRVIKDLFGLSEVLKNFKS